MKKKLVIDTNIIISSLPHKSENHWIIDLIFNEHIELFLTNEILLEYEEMLTIKYSETVAERFVIALKLLPNVFFVNVYFKWDLLKDPDDNKFIDCYVASGADYLLTNDKGFNILRSIKFPPVNFINLDHFIHKIIPGL